MRKYETRISAAEKAAGEHETVFAMQIDEGPINVSYGRFKGVYESVKDLEELTPHVLIHRIIWGRETNTGETDGN